MSISVRNVSKLYGSQKALDNVSFDISPGEVIGFLGPNGAGKSTMMKIITCYIPQHAGNVSVCGFDVSKEPMRVKRNIGYLPEHNPLYLDMFVREYLTFVGELHKVPQVKKRVGEMIELVGLEREAHKKIEELSKGYRQRVGLAQAIIHDPKVLILDEPTTGLDPNQLAEIRSLISNIGRSKTVMLSTHIMQEVEAICSRAIIIHKGSIVADRSTSELRRGASQGYSLMVEFSGPMQPATLKSIGGISSVRNQEGNLWEIAVAGEEDVREAIARSAGAFGVYVITMTRKELKLEDVFKELTTE